MHPRRPAGASEIQRKHPPASRPGGSGGIPADAASRLRDACALGTMGAAADPVQLQPGETVFGLIGKMTAATGQRDALAAMLLEGTRAMPGCLSYIVAHDPGDADALWITEVWDTEESHKASLGLPTVQSAIARARPLIAGFGERVETVPIGGVGLPPVR